MLCGIGKSDNGSESQVLVFNEDGTTTRIKLVNDTVVVVGKEPKGGVIVYRRLSERGPLSLSERVLHGETLPASDP